MFSIYKVLLVERFQQKYFQRINPNTFTDLEGQDLDTYVNSLKEEFNYNYYFDDYRG